MAAKHDLTGAWTFNVDNPGRTWVPAIMMFGGDGSVSVAVPPVQPSQTEAAANLIVASSGFGRWQRDENGATVTFAIAESDLQGRLIDTVTVRAICTTAEDGATATCSFTSTFVDSAGKELAVAPGTMEGTRIVAESPATA